MQRVRLRWPKSFSDSSNHFLMQAVHPSGQPVYLATLNANAAITTGTASLQNGSSGFMLTGNGKHIFQWDAGAVQMHTEFGNRVVANEGSATDRHATHVAGTLIAAGVNPQVKGMAPEAILHAYYFDDDLYKMAIQSEQNPYGFLISNHSYGITTGWNKVNGSWQWFGDASVSSDEDYTAGFYTVRTKQIDDIAFLSPYHTIVWAAGNDRADAGNGAHPPDCNGGTGYDCIIQQATAKNIITVGGVDQVLNYMGPASVPMSFFSSWGPTDDGRIKPDLVGDGLSLLSTTNAGVDQYTTLGGTSMATPNVAGSLLLLQDLHSKLNGGQYMRASTLKALAIHTAKETGTSPGPDYSFGWGLLDVDAAARVLSKRDDGNTFIMEGELLNDATHEWVLNPQANQKITASLVWTDPSGLPPDAALDPPYKMLVNDLDLRLIDASGTIQYPWILDPGNPQAAATRGDNTRDNVEKLEFNLPEAKPYRLQVSHKGFLLNESQHYSLIITYTSPNTSKTLYWIGGSGHWNDQAHWSLTSGGSTANTTPASIDRIIVDENSFPNGGNIMLTANATCASLRWYCTKAAGIDFNSFHLTLTSELTLSSSNFAKSGSGTFLLSSTSIGTVNATEDFSTRPNIEFAAGDWAVRGNLHADTLTVTGGSVALKKSQLTLNHFIGVSANTNLTIDNGGIQIEKSWISDATKLTVISTNATLATKGNSVTIQSPSLNLNGTFITEGIALASGDIAVDSLALPSGATLNINSGSIVTVKNGLLLQGQPGSPVQITSNGTATLHCGFHKKICTDNVSIVNVTLTGNSLITVGANSTLQNAIGWLTQNCDDVLFPDYSVRYACVKALTEFTNTSTGNITTFHWNFGDANSPDNESQEETPTHQFSSAGQYVVVLTVSDGATSRSFTNTITITVNSLPATTIEHNAEVLFSSAEASRYQWFADGEPIPNETNRVFTYGGAQALYRVVLYDDQCNSPSEEFTISGIPSHEPFSVYPNPATGKIYVKASSIEQVILKDIVGRTVNVMFNPNENYVDVTTVSPGMYVLEIHHANAVWKRKVLVQK